VDGQMARLPRFGLMLFSFSVCRRVVVPRSLFGARGLVVLVVTSTAAVITSATVARLMSRAF